MKTIIAGSRDFTDYEILDAVLCHLPWKITEIVSGCARGADNLGLEYALDYDLPAKKFPAEWDKWGKGAGYRRNLHMAEYADALVAFWNGESKGTKHMIDCAIHNGLYIKVFYVNTDQS